MYRSIFILESDEEVLNLLYVQFTKPWHVFLVTWVSLCMRNRCFLTSLAYLPPNLVTFWVETSAGKEHH